MTNEALAELRDDISVFADLGTDPPVIVESPKQSVVRFVRLGEPTELEIASSGILERVGQEGEYKHASVRALLASDRYAALRNWAAQQALLLQQEVENVGSLIEQKGTVNNNIDEVGIEAVDDLLMQTQPSGSTRVLLIDGPAGIGKTNFILNLALRRAVGLNKNHGSLILHVESRGRQLSYIYDLVAFSLQRLRSSVTFDQIPVLVRHGLITIAIDGFDELADPNGYNLAWAQVNELVRSVRGQGTLILAGRETFIGRKRVQQDIGELREGIDLVESFTLSAPSPTQAKKWLSDQGVTEEQIARVEGLLERGSLALRPFFLKQLADPSLIARLEQVNEGSALHFLIEAMISREATKFGGEVDEALSVQEREGFVRAMMLEVARDMADNQASSVSETTLAWAVEIATPRQVPQSVEFLLKNRASYLGFLTVDSRPRHLRFYHEKFQEYFLASVVIDTVSRLEMPKFVTRNIFGTSFLETLASVLEAAPVISRGKFQAGALSLLRSSSAFDRGRKNIASFLLATLHLVEADDPVVLSDLEIDEARLLGNVSSAILNRCIVSQLDVRDADISALDFQDSNIFTLIVSPDSLVLDGKLAPHRLVIVHGGEEKIESDAKSIEEWLSFHSLNPPEEQTGLLSSQYNEHPLVRLLGRAARMRQYWLRRGDDKYADRILNDDQWDRLARLLNENNLITVEKRDASGTDSTFFHIKHAQEILSEDASNPNVVAFYAAMQEDIAQHG
jgi:hypothetical protein